MKKTITAMAAALVASFIVASPASAVPTITTTAATSVASATAVDVPADNTVGASEAVAFSLAGIETGTVVTVSATNASITTALDATGAPVTSASGTSSLTINTGTGTTAAFYVFTKTTAVGTVVINNGGNTWTYYVKGNAGPAYNLSVTLPSSIATGAAVDGTAKVTDVFGNPVAATYTAVSINGTVAGVAMTSATDGTDTFTVTAPATAGTAALQFALSPVPADVTGLAKAVKTADRFVTITDLSAVNAALVAENVALKAQLAAEKAAAAAVKADLDLKIAALETRLVTAQAYVANLKLWISKLQALVKNLRK